MSASDFFQDVVGLGGPDEGLRIVIVLVDVVTDGGDQLFEILEDSAPDSVVRQVAEEALDHVEPRSRGRREVHMETLVFGKPALDTRMFVGRVVVADDVDLLVRGDRLLDQAQKLQPLLMAMTLLAQSRRPRRLPC